MKQITFYFSLIIFGIFAGFQVCAQEITPAQPFPTGEKLTYNISFAHFLDAGFVEIYAAGREKLGEREVNVIRAKIRTNGVVQATLLNLNNDFTSFLAPESNLPVRVERFLRVDEKLTQIEHDFSENQIKNDGNLYDLLSALYQLRNSLSFDKDATQTIRIWENEQVYETRLRVASRQKTTTTVGAFNTVEIEVNTIDNNNFNRYKPLIYLSDDEKHLPVLIRLKHPSGEIRAELASVQIITPEPQTEVALQPPPIPQPLPQALPKSTPARVQPAPRPYVENQLLDEDLPFNLGEKLQYEILQANQPVGKVLLQVGERKQFFGRDSVMLSAIAQPINGATILQANNRIDSYINPDYLVPFRNEIKLSGSFAQYNQVLTFDQDRGKVNSEKVSNIDIPVGTHDILSFVYALRGFRFDNSKTPTDTRAAIFLGNKPVVVTIKPSRETIEIKGKPTPAISLTMSANDPQIDSLGLHLWISDDLQHLPLRLTFNSPLGLIQANLIDR